MRRSHLDREPEIVRIAHQEQGCEGMEQVAQSGDRDLDPLLRPGAGHRFRQGQPERRGLELLLGEVDLPPADVLVRVEGELLVHGRERRDEDLAVGPHRLLRRARELREHADTHRESGVGVVVDLHLAHVGLRVLPVELLDLELLRLVEVDGLLVHEDRRREAVDLPDHARAAVRRVDDHHVVVARGAERHRLGRERLIGPVVPALGLVQDPVLVEVGEDAERVLRAEPLGAVERQLEGGALEVLDQDVQVVRVHQAGLRRPSEDELGMLDDVLVRRRARRDDEGDGQILAAPGTADLLPGRRDRAGIADEHRRLQGADVDAQLERVR